MTLILGIVLFLFFLITGSILLCAIKIEDNRLENYKFLLITPILGAFSMVCFGEILFIFFPLKYVGYIYVTLFIILGFKNRKKLYKLLKLYNNLKFYFLICILAGIIVSIPSLKQFYFNSPQTTNNDIIYYLSSMDWLYNNNLWKSLKMFNTIMIEKPYYNLAFFMFGVTRFGTEILGSQIMGLTFLKSHEVYYSMGITFVSLAVSTCGFLLNYILRLKKRTVLLFLFFISFSLTWFELQRMQYEPQIFGIAGMIFFISILLDLSIKNYKKDQILLGIALAGTVSVYAEFSFSLFIIFIITCISIVISTKNKQIIIFKITNIIKGCLLSLIISPVGMYKAFRFNILAINGVAGDPYNGNIYSLKNYILNFFGIKVFHVPELDKYDIFVFWILFILLIIQVLIILFILLKKPKTLNVILFMILIYFFITELYLRKIKFAYAEYKYLLSIQSIVLIIFFYFSIQFLHYIKESEKKYFFKITGTEIILILTILNFLQINKLYKEHYFYYDKYLMEIENFVKKMPKNSIFNLDGTFNDIHAGTYVLKNYRVRIKGDSYYRKTPFDISQVDYFLKFKDKDKEDIIKNKENIVWENLKYKITKSSKYEYVKLILGNGFYDLEKNNKTYFRWTSSQESIVSVLNESNKEIKLQLIFDVYGINKIDKNIEILLKNIVIGSGKTPSQIKSKIITLKPYEKEDIIIKINEKKPLTKVNTGDPRLFGIFIKNIELEINKE